MKALMLDVPSNIVQWRRRTGADRWDETWEGVLHMPPMPNRDHQAIEGALERWLWQNWAQPGGNRVYHQINVAAVGGWDDDYRIPDLVLLTPDRFHIDHNEYFEGPPAVVVEIHSAGDESYEKLDFYGRVGVPEVWILDRDTKQPAMFVMRGGECEHQRPDADGWLVSGATGVRLRAEGEEKLAMQIADRAETLALIPEDY
jgi:Uma2 family endonuclease